MDIKKGARNKALDEIFDIIADDGYALTFQSMGKYRTALMGLILELKEN